MKVFVDTSYYVARVMPRDQWHRAAMGAVQPGMTFVTSSLVINETISLLQARGHFSAAVIFLVIIWVSSRPVRTRGAWPGLLPGPVSAVW